MPNKDTWSQFSFPFHVRVSGVQNMNTSPANLLEVDSHMVLKLSRNAENMFLPSPESTWDEFEQALPSSRKAISMGYQRVSFFQLNAT